MRIAIITAAPNSYSVKSLIRAILERKHLPEIIDPEDLYIYISDKKKGFDRIYQKELKIQKNEIDAIIPRIGSNLEFGAVTVEHFNKNIGIFSTASASGLLCAQNKMKNQMRLSQAKIRVPKMAFANTLFIWSPQLVLNRLNDATKSDERISFSISECADKILKPTGNSPSAGSITITSLNLSCGM